MEKTTQNESEKKSFISELFASQRRISEIT